MADPRVKKTKEEIAAELQGQWNDSQLFILKDCFESYEQNQKRIEAIDERIEILLKDNMRYELPGDKIITKK